MFQITRARSGDEVDIVFQVPTTLNSITQYGFKLTNVTRANKTMVVSGLDANRPINCTFTTNGTVEKDDYVITLFRMRSLTPDVLNHVKVNVIKVVTMNYHEHWYVLGVKRGRESASTTSHRKLVIGSEEYEKTKCIVQGNVPADLLRAFSGKVQNHTYLHGLLVTSPTPNVCVDSVRLIKDSTSTAF
ncbi:hypothetical protein CaLGV007 [Clostera anastomosis granulovirus A]|uniref:Uncharacterized protein n=1 Tax=Clostera anastomosis granulovirus A TaxID=1986289 RepID=U5KB29_9BBAC|nr:hypothetical protein CaLGV007 [Clostera anastomosis granulovirus Henan]AGQ20266.1 hypothetical protein CaLGV007 [Clostera anastomosis granulovirus Henan]